MIIVKKLKLDNGLKLIMEKRPSVRTAAMTLVVKAGTINENKENNGIAHFVEHVLFMGGTKSRSYKELMSYLQSFGGSANGITQRTYTKYSINILSDFVDKGLEILFDMIINPAFNDEIAEKEKRVILEEINQQTYDQPFVLRQMLFEKSINEGPLGMSIIGTEETVKNMTKDEMHSFYKKYYVPNNMVIAIVGNIEYNDIERKVKALFGKLGPKEVSVPVINSKNRITGQKISEFRKKGLKQAHILLGSRAPTIFDKKRYAMDIIANILGRTMNSMLIRRFVDELCISYKVWTEYNNKEGYYYNSLATSPENLAMAKKELLNLIKTLRKTGITENELSNTKNYIKGVTALYQEYNQGLADIYALAELFTKAEDVDEYNNKIDSVTIDEVNKVIEEFIDDENYVMVILEPEETRR